jgi:hypothetical protein
MVIFFCSEPESLMKSLESEERFLEMWAKHRKKEKSGWFLQLKAVLYAVPPEKIKK